MAIVREMDEKGWNSWVATRPATVQEMCRKLPPDRLYRMNSTGHKVTLHSYSEDGTVTVDVSPDFNQVCFGRRVFGVAVDDLAECDLPEPDEPHGAMLEDEDSIDSFCDAVRESNAVISRE